MLLLLPEELAEAGGQLEGRHPHGGRRAPTHVVERLQVARGRGRHARAEARYKMKNDEIVLAITGVPLARYAKNDSERERHCMSHISFLSDSS